ncbi:uncharacterized protein LOC110092452 isoform X6 [Dendrobium catenatum]|uniref:uncharacterized protein LOC110092452 isoform X6 n=1 Tax=Dendrobium catenatum TaxID=906689 RepID=UPI00109F8ABF|nr:uncharacterized protein LOC110092452 isoform X6 [Dendrobium catenatum]
MRNSTRSRDPLLLPKIPDSRDRSSIRYGTSFMRKEFVGVNFITKSDCKLKKLIAMTKFISTFRLQVKEIDRNDKIYLHMLQHI